MAHFARITNGVILSQQDIHVVANAVLLDDTGQEQEAFGQALLADLWGGNPADYVQCSYNGNPVHGQDRGGYPAAGWQWDGEKFTEPNAPTV